MSTIPTPWWRPDIFARRRPMLELRARLTRATRAFFDERGWHASEVRYIAEEAERLGRPIPLPLRLKLWLTLVGLLASRRRRERMKRFAAYVLLTPR